ncbi:MAG: hypothetical protein KJ626_10465 [Verrucomicrobia bacterium]|nr:hypothetical protein [Verrucomicrobiota bacterium]
MKNGKPVVLWSGTNGTNGNGKTNGEWHYTNGTNATENPIVAAQLLTPTNKKLGLITPGYPIRLFSSATE